MTHSQAKAVDGRVRSHRGAHRCEGRAPNGWGKARHETRSDVGKGSGGAGCVIDSEILFYRVSSVRASRSTFRRNPLPSSSGRRGQSGEPNALRLPVVAPARLDVTRLAFGVAGASRRPGPARLAIGGRHRAILTEARASETISASLPSTTSTRLPFRSALRSSSARAERSNSSATCTPAASRGAGRSLRTGRLSARTARARTNL
jgi:hypothetical protein